MMNIKSNSKKAGARTLSRLLAVQALYLLRMDNEATVQGVINDFKNLDLGSQEPVPQIKHVDEDLFTDIVLGVSKEKKSIKLELDKILKKPWVYDRLEEVLAAILEAGVYELKFRIDIPRPVIINEYVDITHSFYDENEPAFVNGILDELAKILRA